VLDRYGSGREERVEVVRLPLGDDAGAPRFIISCTVALTTARYTDPEDRPHLLAQPVHSRFFAI
jgi:hypothetical protein